eukprot:m.239647 g.239647  ORF g.239647 m.239647 type:complete len:321 (-) comp13512_c0_seq1:187-1149(-)
MAHRAREDDSSEYEESLSEGEEGTADTAPAQCGARRGEPRAGAIASRKRSMPQADAAASAKKKSKGPRIMWSEAMSLALIQEIAAFRLGDSEVGEGLAEGENKWQIISQKMSRRFPEVSECLGDKERCRNKYNSLKKLHAELCPDGNTEDPRLAPRFIERGVTAATMAALGRLLQALTAGTPEPRSPLQQQHLYLQPMPSVMSAPEPRPRESHLPTVELPRAPPRVPASDDSGVNSDEGPENITPGQLFKLFQAQNAMMMEMVKRVDRRTDQLVAVVERLMTVAFPPTQAMMMPAAYMPFTSVGHMYPPTVMQAGTPNAR